jgi:hypothetical protein
MREGWFYGIVWPALGGTIILYGPSVFVVLLILIGAGYTHFDVDRVFIEALVLAFGGGLVLAYLDYRRKY